jgi:hypothetical protein
MIGKVIEIVRSGVIATIYVKTEDGIEPFCLESEKLDWLPIKIGGEVAYDSGCVTVY